MLKNSNILLPTAELLRLIYEDYNVNFLEY